MTTYGNSNRISVTVEGGGIGSVTSDSEQQVVLFAAGDPTSGSVQTNDPTQVSGPGQLESTFGADTEMVEAFRGAAANGVAYANLYGVVPSTQSVTGEQIAGGSGTLGNTPIIEDAATITVTNATAGQEETPVWQYGTPDASSLAADEVAINPFTGEVAAGDADDYEIDYKYHDWQSAFDAATGVIQEQEEGLWYVCSEAESVVSDARATADPLRTSQWKMVRVAGDAQPNATADDGAAQIDAGTYSDTLDADALFVTGPVRTDTGAVSGAVAGVLGGASITDPVLGDALTGVDALTQTLTVPEQEDLEDAGVIPLANSGAVTLESNVSTSTESDWQRTYFSRRLADRLLLTARAVARAVRGRLNNDNTETITEERVADEIVDLVDQGVLEPDTEAEQNWFVDVSEDATNARKLNVAFGFTPVGVVDTVEINQTVNY